jgi:hypothetical protein
MRPAIDSVYVIGERKYLFVVAVVVLHRHLDRKIVTDQLEIKRLVMERALILVQMFYEFRDPPCNRTRAICRLLPLVLDKYADAFIEKCFLAQAARKSVKTVNGLSNISSSVLNVIFVPRFEVVPVLLAVRPEFLLEFHLVSFYRRARSRASAILIEN